MFNKKSQFPMIKTLIILFVATIILLTYMILLSGEKVNINDKKLKTQIVIDRIFNNNCFSNEFGFILKDKFTKESLENCFVGSKELLIRLNLDSEKINPNTIYYNKDQFIKMAPLCKFKSSILCTELKYPILIGDKKSSETSILTIQIISS